MRPIRIVTVSTALIAALSCTLTATADVRPMNELPAEGDVTVAGTVSQVWGSRFALQDDHGSVLVELAPAWYHDFPVEPGEALKVEGRIERDTLAAYRVHRDGETVEIRPEDGPPPWAREDARSPRSDRRAAGRGTDAESDRGSARARGGSTGDPAPAAPASAQRGLSAEQIERARALAEAYGFAAYKEIEDEGDGIVEVEGWMDDTWAVEVDFDLASGRIVKEERERDRRPDNTLSAEDIRSLIRVAQEAGMVSFDEIELENGYAEVEGWDADGREMEMDIEVPGFHVLEIEYD